ncbi:hypothetical protein [Corynebacterium sp. HMSC08D02]|uniref:hypothetical protein n=1 Tax=Corynebacterium sp. HMSC08D02 TaxID=1581138 RepID=UPI001AEF7291|nr:hypothetical protein [Corynebacterium sp. HMSC08D02]
MRFHFGPGYRVYYAQLDAVTVFLLAGGDKSSQVKDIRTPQKLAQQVGRNSREGSNVFSVRRKQISR